MPLASVLEAPTGKGERTRCLLGWGGGKGLEGEKLGWNVLTPTLSVGRAQHSCFGLGRGAGAPPWNCQE